jgi:hypothetical protein
MAWNVYRNKAFMGRVWVDEDQTAGDAISILKHRLGYATGDRGDWIAIDGDDDD